MEPKLMTEFLLGIAVGMAIVLFNFVFLIYHQNKEEKMAEQKFDQSTESRFWQTKALEVAEEIDKSWQFVMSTLRSKPNTYLISEDYYHMVREIKQVMKKYKKL